MYCSLDRTNEFTIGRLSAERKDSLRRLRNRLIAATALIAGVASLIAKHF